MCDSRIPNVIYLKKKSADSKTVFDKQENCCVNLLSSAKKNYFANINISSIIDNKKFWKTIKGLFLDEISHKKTVNAIENDTIFSDYQVVADILNNYVKHINKNLYTQANKKFPKKKNKWF